MVHPFLLPNRVKKAGRSRKGVIMAGRSVNSGQSTLRRDSQITAGVEWFGQRSLDTYGFP